MTKRGGCLCSVKLLFVSRISYIDKQHPDIVLWESLILSPLLHHRGAWMCLDCSLQMCGDLLVSRFTTIIVLIA